jgi:Tol biopolymer transport system component
VRRALLLAALLAALAPASGAAQPYDPAYRWRTLDTPHFRVHFHQGEEALAQRVARAAERAHTALTPLLGYAPRRTEVVLSDDADDANGSATPLPYNTLRLYAVPPSSFSELNDYRDWLDGLVFHEYVHILHLDRIGGFPALFNGVFGKLLVPNGLVPPWMVEGLAVLHESNGDPETGRNASALHAMYARSLALEPPGFPPLDDASNPLLEWPVGTAPYLLGGRFMAYLQARHGDGAIAAYVGRQGAQIWPYAPSWVGARFFGGRTFAELWAEYADAERRRAEEMVAAVRERPVTAARRLTTRGGRAENPRWSPDGTFVAYWRRPLDGRPALYRVSPDGRDLGPVTTVDANGTLTLRSRDEAIAAIGEVHREYRVYDDLHRVYLRSGRRTRLTRGERATDPDLATGGAFVAYVQRTGPGALALVRRPVDGSGRLGAREVLFSRRGAEVYQPRVSPDGRRIAFELQEEGRRDVALWEDGRVTRITDDAALDTSPAWTPDGRHVLFASDRGGLYNLYAWEAASGGVAQVTNVETGALQPDVSPDGRTIAFLLYSRAGYDVATIPFEPESWLEPLPTSTSSSTPTSTSISTSTPSSTPTPSSTSTSTSTASLSPAPTDAPADLPSRPYRALDTLRPTYWLPFLAADAAGTVFGATTGGADVLRRHAWTAQAFWSTQTQEPGYAVAYQGGWSWPLLDLSSSRLVGDSPDPGDRLLSVWTLADAGATFTFTRLSRALALRVGWSGTRYDTLEGEPGADLSLPNPFEDGFLSDVSLLLSYSDARRFVRSISPEEGRSAALVLSYAGPGTGSDYDLGRVRGSVGQYLRVPGLGRTVLALRASGGLARGTLGGSAPYELGGVPQPNLLSVALGSGMPPDALRGYAEGTFEGTGFVLANAELRFPLGAPALGRTTWPLFLRRLHGAVFADLGETFDRPGEPILAGNQLDADALRLGLGAELRLELVLGYYIRTDLRLGLARAMGAPFDGWRAADEEIAPDEVYPYVVLGASF